MTPKQVLASAIKKRRAGEKLNRTEQYAYNGFLRAREAKWREKIYRKIPQSDMRKLAGHRRAELLISVAERYGIPVAGKSVSLYLIFPAMFAFLKKHGNTLLALEDAAEGGADTLTVRYLKGKIELNAEQREFIRVKREEKDRSLVDRNLIDQGLSKLATRIRRAGEIAQRKFGAEGYELFDDLLSGFVRDVSELKATAERSVDDDKPQAGKKRNPKGPGLVMPSGSA